MATSKTPARKRVAVRPTALATPPVVPNPDAEAEAKALEEEEQVQVNVARPYTLHRDNGEIVHFRAGVQQMAKSDAEHWWSVNHGGVKPYDGDFEPR